jgi:hypothetical protein
VKHFLVIILALSLRGAAIAQDATTSPDRCKKSLKIDEFLIPEDAAQAKNEFEQFQNALLSGNREQVIALIHFPADLVLNGSGHPVANASEFASQYGAFFTRYVIRSVRDQKPEELLAGWDGVSLANGAVKFTRDEDGVFRINDIRATYEKLPESISGFLNGRLTCPPVVVEGRVAAYDSATHIFAGPENIYVDHLIFDVSKVVSGKSPEKRIRVDFWGVTNLPAYNLQPKVFDPGGVWRLYLRPATDPPSGDVCVGGVQESIPWVDENKREVKRESAINVLLGESAPTFAGLSCFEVRKQYFIQRDATGAIP